MTSARTLNGRNLVLMFGALLMAVFAWSPAAAFQATPSADTESGSITLSGAILAPATLTVADLQQYPVEELEVTYTSGGESEDHTFTGTSLLGVIEDIGLDVPEDAKNPWLATYVVVTANDGYQVVVSGGELDPAFGNQPVYLAWEQDGEALTGDDGPVRLVVPGDTKGGRYVHGIVSIEVFRVSIAE